MSSLQEVMSTHGDNYIKSKRLSSNILRALSAFSIVKQLRLAGIFMNAMGVEKLQ